MNTKEITTYIDEILRQFWPDWKPPAIEIELWTRKLANIEYPDAKDAAERAFAAQAVNAKRPIMAAIMARCQAQARPAAPDGGQAGVGPDGFFLAGHAECVEHPNARNIGWQRELWVRAGTDFDYRSQPERGLAQITRYAKDHKETYGGEWIGVQK